MAARSPFFAALGSSAVAAAAASRSFLAAAATARQKKAWTASHAWTRWPTISTAGRTTPWLRAFGMQSQAAPAAACCARAHGSYSVRPACTNASRASPSAALVPINKGGRTATAASNASLSLALSRGVSLHVSITD